MTARGRTLQTGRAGRQQALTDHGELSCERATDKVVAVEADEVFVADVPVVQADVDVLTRAEDAAEPIGLGFFGLEGRVADVLGQQCLPGGRSIAVARRRRKSTVHAVAG